MWGAIAYGGFLVGSYVYHRWFVEQPPMPKPADRVEIPRLDDGAAPALIYGKCRVRSPIIAWCSTPAVSGGPNVWSYSMDMLMLLGIPFENPSVAVWRIWVGEQRLGLANPGQPKTHNPGGLPQAWIMDNTGGSDPWSTQRGLVGQFVEILDGRATQQLVNPTSPYASTTIAGARMVADAVDASMIPGYRGYVGVFHYGGGGAKWSLGNSNDLGSYSYEVSSYPADSDAFNVGVEANPAKVLRDVLTGKFGKLGLPSSKIDGASFGAAKVRFQEEGNGYSRSIEGAPDTAEIVREIEEQCDCVVFEDSNDGLIKIKLVRDDYDPGALIGVTTENCESLQNFAAGGFESVVNKVRVVYEDRDDDYREHSATAHSQASATGSDGEVREALIRMPGVKTAKLAAEIAARELNARSRPIAKCRAIVDRTFRKVNPGDPIRVTWPEYGIDGRVFRVASVNRGELANGKIALDLIEDFYYVWRNALLPGHPVESFPGGPVGGGL